MKVSVTLRKSRSKKENIGILYFRVRAPEYKLDELKKELLRLAQCLKLDGYAQVDLIFSNEKWYIIEINPRLSGMTTSYAASAGMNFYEYIFRAVTVGLENIELKDVVNKKIPLQTEDELNNLSENPDVLFLSQIENMVAKQEREKGFCEMIVSLSGLTRQSV